MNQVDRPDEFRYGLSYGTVIEVYPDAWEVDVAMATGGITRHAQVLGPRLPERNAKDRPQWVVVGWVDAQHAQAVCWPVESRLAGPRAARAGFVLYDERDNYRMTIDAAGNYEILNARSGAVTRVRIEEAGPVIRIETPSTHVVLDEGDRSIEVMCDGDLRASVGGDVVVEAGGDATVEAAGDVTLENGAGAKIQLTGNQVMIN